MTGCMVYLDRKVAWTTLRFSLTARRLAVVQKNGAPKGPTLSSTSAKSTSPSAAKSNPYRGFREAPSVQDAVGLSSEWESGCVASQREPANGSTTDTVWIYTNGMANQPETFTYPFGLLRPARIACAPNTVSYGDEASISEQFFDETRDQSQAKATIVSKYFWAWARVIMPTAKKWQKKI